VSTMRIGVAGAGAIGRKHVELIEASRDCVVAGIADPSPEAKAFASARGIDWYADHRELLEETQPDGLIVASPNALHLAMALDCIEHGMPALVEKPVTDTVMAAQELLRATKRSGVPVLVGHHRRHNPRIKAIRDAIAAGQIGQLTAVVGLWLLKKPDDYFDVAWRREPGGGPVLINLVHDLDNLRFICGEIVHVQALTSNKARGFAVEDTAALLLRFANGALGHGDGVRCHTGAMELGIVVRRKHRLRPRKPALLSVCRHEGLALRADHGAVVLSRCQRLVHAARPHRSCRGE
jgi:predicted dehydrogenase